MADPDPMKRLYTADEVMTALEVVIRHEREERRKALAQVNAAVQAQIRQGILPTPPMTGDSRG